jgi:hypothetical protein
MNERIRELAEQCHHQYSEHNIDLEKFAEMIVQDTINILKQEWYDLNNAPKEEKETPRGIGLRVGAKSQTIRLIHKIQKHFGLEQ